MSGQRNRKPDDIIKHRQEYLNNLNLEIQLQDANEQAVKLYKDTGQLPPVSQMKDNRTAEDKLRDFEKLKLSIVEDLAPIADSQFAMNIIQRIIQSPLNNDNQLLIFFAQRASDIVANMKKQYKFGIEGSDDEAIQFVNFIYKYYNEKNVITQNTKEFLNRVGVNTSMGLAKKLETQQVLLNRLGAEISANRNQLATGLGGIVETRENREIYKKIQILFVEIIDIERSIISLINNFTYIYPSNPLFFENIEKLLNSFVAGVEYEEINNDLETYLNFINHNLPNTDFFNPLVNDLRKYTLNGYKILRQERNNLTQASINSFEKVKMVLTSIYDQLDTGDSKNTLRTIRGIYNNILRYIKKYGTEKPSLLKPKGIGKEDEFMTSREYFEEPELPSDFRGMEDIDYWSKDVYPDFFDDSEKDKASYINNYIKPFLELVKRESDKRKFNDELSKEKTVEELVNTKKNIRKYLADRKISTDRLIERLRYNYYEPEGMNDEDKKFDIREWGETLDLQRPYSPQRGLFEDDDNLDDYLDERSEPSIRYERVGNIERPSATRRGREPEVRPFPAVRRPLPFRRPVGEKEEEEEEEKKKEEPKFTKSEKDMFDYFIEWDKDNEITESIMNPEEYQRYKLYRRITGKGLKSKMKGRGIGNKLAFTKEKIDISRGVKEEPRYIKFGRYLINTRKLKDDILSLRRGTGTQIASLPVYKMSPNLSKVVKKIVGGTIPKSEDYNDLTDEEKRYLYKVSRESDLDNKIEIPTPNKDEDEKEIHQFHVYKGEIMAGNDSKELIKKFKALLVKLSKKNVLDKREVADILETIVDLGH